MATDAAPRPIRLLVSSFAVRPLSTMSSTCRAVGVRVVCEWDGEVRAGFNCLWEIAPGGWTWCGVGVWPCVSERTQWVCGERPWVGARLSAVRPAGTEVPAPHKSLSATEAVGAAAWGRPPSQALCCLEVLSRYSNSTESLTWKALSTQP